MALPNGDSAVTKRGFGTIPSALGALGSATRNAPVGVKTKSEK